MDAIEIIDRLYGMQGMDLSSTEKGRCLQSDAFLFLIQQKEEENEY